jgi:hypothetical protein
VDTTAEADPMRSATGRGAPSDSAERLRSVPLEDA